MRTRAVIDIGSNSVKVLIAALRSDAEQPLEVLDSGSWVTRLGRGLDQTKTLSAESVAATEAALREMRARIDAVAAKHGNIQVEAVATAAVRECRNPEEISARVRAILGVELRILSGKEEAHLSLTGAAQAARLMGLPGPYVFIDVGGASTEIGMLEPSERAHSFFAGAVRCHEGLGLSEIPVSQSTWNKAKHDIAEFFPEADWQKIFANAPRPRSVVAIGGTLVLGARLCGARALAHVGYALRRRDFEKLNERLRQLTIEQRRALPGMMEGREDIVCAGLLCVTHPLERMGIEDFCVTEWGLRHGLLFHY